MQPRNINKPRPDPPSSPPSPTRGAFLLQLLLDLANLGSAPPRHSYVRPKPTTDPPHPPLSSLPAACGPIFTNGCRRCPDPRSRSPPSLPTTPPPLPPLRPFPAPESVCFPGYPPAAESVFNEGAQVWKAQVFPGGVPVCRRCCIPAGRPVNRRGGKHRQGTTRRKRHGPTQFSGPAKLTSRSGKTRSFPSWSERRDSICKQSQNLPFL